MEMLAVDRRVMILGKHEFARRDACGGSRFAHAFKNVRAHYFAGLSASSDPRPTSHKKPTITANGMSESASAYGPAKNGLFAFAHALRLASVWSSTPAMKAMTIPAMAPPAM